MESLRFTLLKRPDLIQEENLSKEEKEILKKIRNFEG